MQTLSKAPSVSISTGSDCTCFNSLPKSFSSVPVTLLCGIPCRPCWNAINNNIVIALPKKFSKHLSFMAVEQSNVTDVFRHCKSNSVGKSGSDV